MKETFEQYLQKLKDRRTEDEYRYTDEDFKKYIYYIFDCYEKGMSVYKCLELMYFAERDMDDSLFNREPKQETENLKNFKKLVSDEISPAMKDFIKEKQETQEYDLLQHIKFCLECKNEAQAIRLIEKYGFVKQEERYTEQELKLWLKHRDVYLYNHYTTYIKSGLPLQSVEDFIKESHEYLMDREQINKK